MKKTGTILEKITEGLFAGMMTAALLLVLLFSGAAYNCKITFLLPNWALCGAALVLSLLLVMFVCRQRQKHWMGDAVQWLDRMVPWILLGLFVVEVYISFCIFFQPGWDPGTLWKRAWQRIYGDSWGDYFSRYPNNLLLLLLETFLLRFNSAFGVFPGDYAQMCCILVDCAAIALSCGLTYQVMKNLTGPGWALVSFLFCILLAGLSPWMCIFYSDTLGILFPILTLYLYTKPGKTRRNRVLAILVGCVGYFLKPQCIIMVIAILGMEIVYAIQEKTKTRALRALGLAVLSAAVILVLSNVLVWQYESADVQLEKEESFGMAHFFMMGLNEETTGAFSSEDADFSAGFATSGERTRGDIARALDRLQQMGPGGYLRHLSQKLLMTFHDGTFGWWVEGTFYTPLVDAPNTHIAPALRSLYYRDGGKHEVWKLAAQALWMAALLLGTLYGLLSLKKQGRFETSVLKLALFGTVLFLLLFECRARYLFMHVPLFCCLAGLGLEELAQCIKRKRIKE